MDSLIIFGAKYLIFIVCIIFVIFFLTTKKRKRVQFILYTITLGLSAFVVSRIASFLYDNPRPFISDGVVPLINYGIDNGFVSDHTLLAGALAAVITIFNWRLGVFMWVLAVVIGISRVFAGVHHYIDIAGSLFITGFLCFIFFKFLNLRKHF